MSESTHNELRWTLDYNESNFFGSLKSIKSSIQLYFLYDTDVIWVFFVDLLPSSSWRNVAISIYRFLKNDRSFPSKWLASLSCDKNLLGIYRSFLSSIVTQLENPNVFILQRWFYGLKIQTFLEIFPFWSTKCFIYWLLSSCTIILGKFSSIPGQWLLQCFQTFAWSTIESSFQYRLHALIHWVEIRWVWRPFLDKVKKICSTPLLWFLLWKMNSWFPKYDWTQRNTSFGNILLEYVLVDLDQLRKISP